VGRLLSGHPLAATRLSSPSFSECHELRRRCGAGGGDRLLPGLPHDQSLEDPDAAAEAVLVIGREKVVEDGVDDRRHEGPQFVHLEASVVICGSGASPAQCGVETCRRQKVAYISSPVPKAPRKSWCN
jgi:hypothetical protein